MASTLSPSAIYRIIFFVVPADEKNEYSRRDPWLSRYPDEFERVNEAWKAIYNLYMKSDPAQPLDYLDSLELAVTLKGDVDDADVRAIFACGEPLHFWSCPRLLVTKLVEAFRGLQKESRGLDVTINVLPRFGAESPSEAWAQVYRANLPCSACTMVETVDTQRNPHLGQTEAHFAVEKFHVSSEHFRNQLTVALHYELEAGMTGTERELLGSDFAPEVFGFLDRALVGSSLLANGALHDLICGLKQCLPVHHLKCTFSQSLRYGYRLAVRHFRRDLPYTDVRHFMLPSPAGAENDSALIRHYLSNSHVSDLIPPRSDFPFAIKMLASLATRNCSVGRTELFAGTVGLSDHSSNIAVAFGGMRVGHLDLSCGELRFVELVQTTDFFRMPTVRGLRRLVLTLTNDEESGVRATATTPLWLSGIHLLRNCAFYGVHYESGRHLQAIEREIVQICEVHS